MDAPGIQEFMTKIEKQKAILAAAKKRKGEIPRTRKSHLQLTREHWHGQMSAASLEAEEHLIRQTFVGEAYPPCTVQLQDLQPIRITELQLEIHHRGKVLYARTFCEPLQMSSIQNVVEDDHRTPEKIAVYHTHSSTPMSKILPAQAVIAVKEPYYKVSADGGPIIRIDHPSDLVILQHGDPAIPPWFRAYSAKTALEHKSLGNAAHTARDYIEAESQYSLAIRRCGPVDQQLKRDALRNRSLINIYLQRFRLAEADALASIIPKTTDSGEKAQASNQKAFFRAGRAKYELGEFSDASGWFEKCLEIDPNDGDSTREHHRTAQRLQEAQHGQFDFDGLTASLSKKHTRCDVASFLQRTQVAASGIAEGGRGLFASQDIKAGDIVLCEKAFAFASPADNERTTEILLNVTNSSTTKGTNVMILRDIVRKVQHDEELASRVFNLFADHYPATPPLLVDGEVAVDTFQAMAIINRNCFGAPPVRSSDPDPPGNEQEVSMRGSSGIWVQASYINHACQANAFRAFFGDLMVVRATKDIAKGAEIFMPYRQPDPDATEMSRRTQHAWGFTCTCNICTAELSSSSGTKQRADTIKAGLAFCKANPIKLTSKPSQALISKAERLFKTIEEAYDKPAFHGVLPRLGLVHLGCWLLQASSVSTALSPQKTIDLGTRVLQHLGFGITVSKNSKLIVDRTQFVLLPEAVDVAVRVGLAFQAKGGRHFEIGKEYMALAKGWHVAVKGELKGFDERYGL